MKGLIYCHINKVNGKRYIGLTKQKVEKRGQNGFGYNVGTQAAFGAAIKKYGGDGFDHIILEDNISTLALANEREKYGIAYYHTGTKDTECNGYNITQGGDGATGRTISKEIKQKIRKKLLLNPSICKKVICIELDKAFESCSQAEQQLKCRHVGECCNKQRDTAGGYHWAFLNDLARQKELEQYKNIKKEIKYIKCIETNEIFKTKFEAKQKYGIHVIECCNGIRKQTHRLHFEGIKIC